MYAVDLLDPVVNEAAHYINDHGSHLYLGIKHGGMAWVLDAECDPKNKTGFAYTPVVADPQPRSKAAAAPTATTAAAAAPATAADRDRDRDATLPIGPSQWMYWTLGATKLIEQELTVTVVRVGSTGSRPQPSPHSTLQPSKPKKREPKTLQGKGPLTAVAPP